MNNNYQNNTPVQPAYTAPAQNLPMTFHNFYKWWLTIIGALSLIPAFMFIGGDSTSLSVPTFVTAALNLATGICLMQMMKAGKIMQTIVNVLGIISNSLGSLTSLLFIFCGGLFAKYLSGEIGSLTGGVFVIIGIVLLISCVAGIVINSCILKYYGKRKHLFVK